MIQPFDCYRARTNYHRTDNLREGAPPNGTTLLVQAMYVMDENGAYPGEWIFMPASYYLWLPQRDLILIEKVDWEVFLSKRTQSLNYQNLL